MRVAVDAQLTVGTATGIGEYVRGLIDALRHDGVDVAELREVQLDPWRFDRRVLWDQILLPRRARRARPDVLHCASGTVPRAVGVPIVVTAHDVAWLRVQSHTRAYARYYFGRFSIERYRRVEQIAVDSEFSRSELLQLLDDYDPQRVHVVYPGVADDFCRLERRGGDGRTILAVGTVEPRKNLEAVIRALPSLDGARVVAVGPPTSYQRQCEALATTLGVDKRVEFRGYIERSELLDLYATCAVVAVSSHYEGFGYAAAQALCAGAPCVVSDQSALPEIVGADAPIVPVNDNVAWTAALATALAGGNDERATQARSSAIARYSWPASARRMRTVYTQALVNR